MRKYDETYDIVVSMAKTKMLMNSHKGDIESLAPAQLITMGKEEFEELFDAINEDAGYMHVIEEVADILNFAVAAAHKAIEGYRSRKDEQSN